MPSRKTGHFVQIWRPIRKDEIWPSYIEVEGRKWATTIGRGQYALADGWTGVSRELDLRRAKQFAKAYAKAGFPSRIKKIDGDGTRIVYTKEPNRARSVRK